MKSVSPDSMAFFNASLSSFILSSKWPCLLAFGSWSSSLMAKWGRPFSYALMVEEGVYMCLNDLRTLHWTHEVAANVPLPRYQRKICQQCLWSCWRSLRRWCRPACRVEALCNAPSEPKSARRRQFPASATVGVRVGNYFLISPWPVQRHSKIRWKYQPPSNIGIFSAPSPTADATPIDPSKQERWAVSVERRWGEWQFGCRIARWWKKQWRPC